jgi:hypothetical protein
VTEIGDAMTFASAARPGRRTTLRRKGVRDRLEGGVMARHAADADRNSGATRYWLGVYYPIGYTIAVIDDLEEARMCARELRDEGIPPSDVQVITGEQAFDIHRRQRHQESLLDKNLGRLPGRRAWHPGRVPRPGERGIALCCSRATSWSSNATGGPTSRPSIHTSSWTTPASPASPTKPPPSCVPSSMP